MTTTIGVIDFETTGLFPSCHHRVIELAVVVVGLDGRVKRELASLVNPGRDVGPTSVHGLSAEDFVHAPSFAEIAGELVECLDGVVAIAAHNVLFERDFLAHELALLGLGLPECLQLCTLRMGGRRTLTDACKERGLVLEKAHDALADARATAQLLARLLEARPDVRQEIEACGPVRWPSIGRSGKGAVTREDAGRRQRLPPTFLQRLLRREEDDPAQVASDGAALAYAALLDRALEDRRIDDAESEALVETATRWGLGLAQVENVHREYVGRLIVAAIADGVVSEAERRDLLLVGRLLGQDESRLEAALRDAAARLGEVPPRPSTAPGATAAALRICFTGECRCKQGGELITRERAAELVAAAGHVMDDRVTKKLDVLVVSDPHTQSGKAKKAREYGIRIVHEAVFWQSIGVPVE